MEEKPRRWTDRWTREQRESRGRASCDQRDPIKTVEVDTSRPYSYSAPNFRRSHHLHYHSEQPRHSTTSHSVASPLHKAHQNLSINSPITPSPSKIRLVQVHSASPRCPREERNYPTAQTPNLGSTYYHCAGAAAIPNYMAATASAKARVRSQSAPRQRPLTPERERTGSAKKRLSFPVPEPHNEVNIADVRIDQNLRIPSLQNNHECYFGIEQRSNMSSYGTDSIGDEISPPSTSDLRRWLR